MADPGNDGDRAPPDATLPTEAQDANPSKRCAKARKDDETAEVAPSPKPLFRIVPVDPKNTLDLEDTADK